MSSTTPGERPAWRLAALARHTGLALHGADVEITGLSADSRRVRPGDLFVAVPGTRTDGAEFVSAALGAGAAAVCTVRPMDGVPTLVAADPRAALADLAAAYHGWPAREVSLAGITGSLGKTSTALLVQACLAGGGGMRVGVIGSLGVHARGTVHDTGMTTPDAVVMQQELRWMADEGVAWAVMEVSSHGILLDRVRGLELALGVFTNLVPDEHLEFHPTPEHYVETKLRFLDMLRPGAPLVFDADDAMVAAAVRERRPANGVGVSLQARDEADVVVRDVRRHAAGSDFTLELRQPLVTLAGAVVADGGAPLRVPLQLPLLGRQQIGNAALAAVAAMLAGVPPADVAAGLARVAPIRRRMEIVHAADPLVVDDTAGNARSIELVRETVTTIPHERLHIAYVVRGLRGPTVNAHNADALADLAREAGATLVVSASEDAADERNRTSDEEREAVLETLRRRGVPFAYEPRLADAVRRVLDGAGAGDVVLLLGAQGMDAGAAMVRAELDARRPTLAARPEASTV